MPETADLFNIKAAVSFERQPRHGPASLVYFGTLVVRQDQRSVVSGHLPAAAAFVPATTVEASSGLGLGGVADVGRGNHELLAAVHTSTPTPHPPDSPTASPHLP
jgi:hypothetical protein